MADPGLPTTEARTPDEKRAETAQTPECYELAKMLAAADPKYRPESAFYMRFAASLLNDTNFADWLAARVAGLVAERQEIQKRIEKALTLHFADGYGPGPDYDCMTCGYESGWPCPTAAVLSDDKEDTDGGE